MPNDAFLTHKHFIVVLLWVITIVIIIERMVSSAHYFM